jgi:hypothetical protein
MTASSADTAELPRVRRSPPIVRSDARLLAPPPPPLLAPTPEWTPVAPVAAPPAVDRPAPGRATRRAERLAARRLRRRWALLGLAVMAGTLAATIVVLDVLH